MVTFDEVMESQGKNKYCSTGVHVAFRTGVLAQGNIFTCKILHFVSFN